MPEMSLNQEHCQQQLEQTRKYLKTKGKASVVHDHLRNLTVCVEFLLKEVDVLNHALDMHELGTGTKTDA